MQLEKCQENVENLLKKKEIRYNDDEEGDDEDDVFEDYDFEENEKEDVPTWSHDFERTAKAKRGRVGDGGLSINKDRNGSTDRDVLQPISK